MFESILTISIVGLFVGFLFSVPVAGPISILITSHSLKGERRYSVLAASGAAIVDLVYCFVAVFGFTQLFNLYQPIVPFILTLGSIFLFAVGIRISRTKLDLDHIGRVKSKNERIRRMEKKGGFWTGFFLNLLNPSLFFGWLTSSFVVMSFVASLGFNVGGLETMLENNVETLNGYDSSFQTHFDKPDFGIKMRGDGPVSHHDNPEDNSSSGLFQIVNSLSFAVFVALGTILWFYLFSGFVVNHRKKISITFINRLIHILGFFLSFFGIFLLYRAVNSYFS